MTDIERKIEDAFVKFVESHGGKCLKLREDGRNGFPDRTVLTPNHRVIFIEFKRNAASKLQASQIKQIEELRDLGFRVLVTHDLDRAKEFYLRAIQW